jgi:hypothetical protein
MFLTKQIDEILATIALNHYFSVRDNLIPKKHFYEDLDLPRNIRDKVESIKDENPILLYGIEPYLDRIDDGDLQDMISWFMENGSGETTLKIIGKKHLDEYISVRKKLQISEINRNAPFNLSIKENGVKQKNIVKIKKCSRCSRCRKYIRNGRTNE